MNVNHQSSNRSININFDNHSCISPFDSHSSYIFNAPNLHLSAGHRQLPRWVPTAARPSVAVLGVGLRHAARGHAGGRLPRCLGEAAPRGGQETQGGAMPPGAMNHWSLVVVLGDDGSTGG